MLLKPFLKIENASPKSTVYTVLNKTGLYAE